MGLRIGVGTTSPSVALDVSGAVTIRNGLRIGASGTNANLVQYGINSTSNSSGTLTVTFPQAFASTPTISATILTTRANVTEYNWLYQLLSVSTTGFTYRVLFTTIAVPSGQYGAGGGDPTSLHWVAYA